MKKIVILFIGLILLPFCHLSQGKDDGENKIAQRIIALAPHSVELLYAIGAGDRIVATTEYADYPKAALKIPRVGNANGIQIERVIELKPDLVIVWQGGNKSADIQKLKSLGVNLLSTQPFKISDISKELRQLGKLTGLEQQANKVIEEVEKRYKEITNKYKSRSKVKTFYQLWHDPLTSIGPDSWLESLLNDCNAENIFKDAFSSYPVVSIESVLVKNPQAIIIPHHSGDNDLQATEKTRIWKKWSEISAVKNGHVSVINGDLLHRFTPRVLDGLQTLCEDIDKVRRK